MTEPFSRSATPAATLGSGPAPADPGPGTHAGSDPDAPADLPALLASWRERALALEQAVAGVVIGQPQLLRLVTVALLARGHVLLEGDVGVGKTTLLRAFARGIGGGFERIEGTVDLMPGDLLHHTWIDDDGRPRIEPGPLLRHGERLATFFFNEINRARPQVQALLLRAMAERTVTAFNREWTLPQLTVFADRNGVETEETFELPSAARDRFLFELPMRTPADDAVRTRLLFEPDFLDADALVAQVPAGLLDWRRLSLVGDAIQRSVHAAPALQRYVLDLWRSTAQPQHHGVAIDGVDVDRLVVAGASPRGMMALVRAARVVAWLDGRDHLLPRDVQAVAAPVLTHRIFLAPVYEMRRAAIAPELVAQLLAHVPVPRA